ncbi:hypothetical protein TcWFU_001806 [Taenia crassiceps]|uniref:Uncharacterized protein n=1 Tax=Taenia crassiceps TaxID=6207 RepID=A0ABR4Q811_9CEST
MHLQLARALLPSILCLQKLARSTGLAFLPFYTLTMIHPARQPESPCYSSLVGGVRRGEARRGEARRGKARRRVAEDTDDFTFRLPCLPSASVDALIYTMKDG